MTTRTLALALFALSHGAGVAAAQPDAATPPPGWSGPPGAWTDAAVSSVDGSPTGASTWDRALREQGPDDAVARVRRRGLAHLAWGAALVVGGAVLAVAGLSCERETDPYEPGFGPEGCVGANLLGFVGIGAAVSGLVTALVGLGELTVGARRRARVRVFAARDRLALGARVSL